MGACSFLVEREEEFSVEKINVDVTDNAFRIIFLGKLIILKKVIFNSKIT